MLQNKDHGSTKRTSCCCSCSSCCLSNCFLSTFNLCFLFFSLILFLSCSSSSCCPKTGVGGLSIGDFTLSDLDLCSDSLDLDLDLDLDCLGERDLERDDNRELDLDDTDDFDLFLSSLPFKGSVSTSFLQNKLDLSICIYCN